MSRLVLLVLGSLALAACGGTGDDTVTVPPTDPQQAPQSQAREFRVSVRDGEVVGGPQEWKVTQGVEIGIAVDLDEGDTVVIDGMQESVKVPDEGVGTVTFTADEAGSFDVMLENADLRVATLHVEPDTAT